MFEIDDLNIGLHFIDTIYELDNTELRYTVGYYKEINDFHIRQTFTLLQSTKLFPALKTGLEYYNKHKSKLKEGEKVFVFIKLNDESYIKIFINSSLDISLFRNQLSEEEYNSIKELLMELKLKK